jgi:hypothetical protein
LPENGLKNFAKSENFVGVVALVVGLGWLQIGKKRKFWLGCGFAVDRMPGVHHSNEKRGAVWPKNSRTWLL